MGLVMTSLKHFFILFQQSSYFTCMYCCFITTALVSTEPYCSNISFFHFLKSVLQQYAWGSEVQAWSPLSEYALVFIKHLLYQWQCSSVRWCSSAPGMLKAPICVGLTYSDSVHTSLGDRKCCALHCIIIFILLCLWVRNNECYRAQNNTNTESGMIELIQPQALEFTITVARSLGLQQGNIILMARRS